MSIDELLFQVKRCALEAAVFINAGDDGAQRAALLEHLNQTVETEMRLAAEARTLAHAATLFRGPPLHVLEDAA